jgi:hypothetical protein
MGEEMGGNTQKSLGFMLKFTQFALCISDVAALI